MSVFQSILTDLKKAIDIRTTHTETLARICTDVLGVTILPEQVSVSKGVLVLRIPSTIKMTLVLKRDVLLQKVRAYDALITSIG